MRLTLRTRAALVAALALGLAGLWMGSLRPGVAWGQAELFVANANNNSITVYPGTASGDTAPARTLAGAATGLSGPFGLVVDRVNDELVIANFDNSSVTVYPRTASGSVFPIRRLAGFATGLNLPYGLVVDPVHDELLVANADSITVYPRAATGSAAPLRRLAGTATGLDSPAGIVVDRVNDELVVVNFGSITVYPRTATGNTPPLRTLAGASTGLAGPFGLVVDTLHDELVVANANNDSITVYARTASGDSPPIRTLAGASTGLAGPFGVVVDTVNDELVVANSDGNAITVYARAAGGDTPPVRTLSGGATGLNQPSFLVVTANTFADVPLDDPFVRWVEALFRAGITGGCATSPPAYCPQESVTRAQMAVFLLRGIHGATYSPPAATGTVFGDVPASQALAKWIEQLAREGITGGCSTTPPQYCPDDGVTRGQMAVFLLRATHGPSYGPPAPTGTMFGDVPLSHPFAAWIEQLAREGVTGGCSTSPPAYCPDDAVTRAQMAVFLVRAFGLPMGSVSN